MLSALPSELEKGCCQEARGTGVLELTEDLTEVFLQCFQV